MAEDWSAHVKKYVPHANLDTIASIVQYCNTFLKGSDTASLVSLNDKSEVDWIRENFLKKKLGLTSISDTELDSAIHAVGTRIGQGAQKNRVTLYYLLAEHFGKLAIFDKLAQHTGGVNGLAAAQSKGCAFLKRCGLRRCWLMWLVVLVLLLLLLFYLSMHRSRQPVSTASAPPVATQPRAVQTNPLPATTVTPPLTVPMGAGVTTEFRNGKPVVSVYFDTGNADVDPSFAAAATSLNMFLKQNPGSKLEISGFNDQTGDKAANAELSKNRAKAVQDALVAADVPLNAVELVKPEDTTDASITNAKARRVDIVAK